VSKLVIYVALGILALGAGASFLVFEATRSPSAGPAVAERAAAMTPLDTRAEPVRTPSMPSLQPPPSPAPVPEGRLAQEPGSLLLLADRSPVPPDSPVARAREEDHRRIRRAEWLKNQAATGKAQRK
jgi:hypothetical protein